ncbi:carbohydrate ABC transporter permease [Paenibacillus sp. J2TS4]|uniref:carbohydrate ABC transporter permease n=1 Tax=Paenibacillus sp. J2TS4 TaxID=2807194 RepID=UPI001B27A89F|nr:carbohydrate ABC transporter permease [Paenibacillus sp. J2TS4]GIP32666.1 putative ABC transporter permease protein YesQ [Paenibacillus sp. J2TS4]
MIYRKIRTKSVLYHICVLLLALVMIYPVLWMVSSSLKDSSEVFVNSHKLIPSVWKFENYVQGWKGFGGHTFAVFFKNSLLITIVATIGGVVTSTLVAYGFSRVKFAGAGFWFTCMLVSMMLPGQVMIIPQYIFFQKMDWINTFYPIIVPSFFGMPFLIFMIMQFIRGLPVELDESAKIDGCGKYAIFFRIIVPLIVPAVVTATIFKFYWMWDEFFGPLIYLNKPELYPLSLALKMFSDPDTTTDWGAMFAMSVLSLIPVVIVFILSQKQLVEGISTTGLKA